MNPPCTYLPRLGGEHIRVRYVDRCCLNILSPYSRRSSRRGRGYKALHADRGRCGRCPLPGRCFRRSQFRNSHTRSRWTRRSTVRRGHRACFDTRSLPSRSDFPCTRYHRSRRRSPYIARCSDRHLNMAAGGNRLEVEAERTQ